MTGTRGPRRIGAAALVALVLAGCGGGGGGSGQAGFKAPKGPATATLSIKAGNFFFDPNHPTVAHGIVQIDLQSENGIHDLVFTKVPGFDLEVDGTGSQASSKIDLKPGTYTFYCSLPGHRQQGMEGTLTVT